ncbi:hypothetical protein [Streptomyces sp. GbtcB6]|uniref:hypothetical protein n=1 Tax=Streptomyces sp. GbtcB6 TaxID=2824751 RepID=UPI0027E502C3|nr:hypothetical protein [Streptomyces sp. GbtcB6]
MTRSSRRSPSRSGSRCRSPWWLRGGVEPAAAIRPSDRLADHNPTRHRRQALGVDPARPEGPYEDSLSLIESGLLNEFGVRHVGISGYPEGHPAIAEDVLWSALRDKSAALAAQGLDGSVITQFGFDVDPVLAWIERVRGMDIALPVRIGVPGPAGVRRLMSYAARFGVGTSATIAKKYGLSLTNLMGTAGPDRFLRALAEGYDPARHGEVKVHFYTFGGLRASTEWAARFRKEIEA